MEIGYRGNSIGSAAGSDSIWIMNRIPETMKSKGVIRRAAMTEGMEIETEIETETAIATGTVIETRTEIGSDELAVGAAQPGRNAERGRS